MMRMCFTTYGEIMPDWKNITAIYKGNVQIYKVYLADEQVWPVQAPKSITIAQMPAKVSYNVGDRLNLSGIRVDAIYAGYYTDNVTSQCTFSPANNTVLSSAGVTTITASFTEKGVTKTTTFDVAVTSSSGFGSYDLSANWTESTLTLAISEADTQTQNQTHTWLSSDSSLVINDYSRMGTIVYEPGQSGEPEFTSQVPLDANNQYVLTNNDLPSLSDAYDAGGYWTFSYWTEDEYTPLNEGDILVFSWHEPEIDGEGRYEVTLHGAWEWIPDEPDPTEEE